MYLILVIFTVAMTLLVQQWLKSTYSRWSQVANTAGLSGVQVARAILDANGLHEVNVEPVKGVLSDHYDPMKNTVRLSEGNYSKNSVAAMAVAAHEVGHAIQHAQAYAPLKWRTTLVPAASFGGNLGPYMVMFGLFLGLTNLAIVGIVLFAAAVLFQVVTLPIEYDASNRAMQQLESLGLVTPGDSGGSRQVLNAAALTYVAGLATSVLYLLYFISMFAGRD